MWPPRCTRRLGQQASDRERREGPRGPAPPAGRACAFHRLPSPPVASHRLPSGMICFDFPAESAMPAAFRSQKSCFSPTASPGKKSAPPPVSRGQDRRTAIRHGISVARPTATCPREPRELREPILSRRSRRDVRPAADPGRRRTGAPGAADTRPVPSGSLTRLAPRADGPVDVPAPAPVIRRTSGLPSPGRASVRLSPTQRDTPSVESAATRRQLGRSPPSGVVHPETDEAADPPGLCEPRSAPRRPNSQEIPLKMLINVP